MNILKKVSGKISINSRGIALINFKKDVSIAAGITKSEDVEVTVLENGSILIERAKNVRT